MKTPLEYMSGGLALFGGVMAVVGDWEIAQVNILVAIWLMQLAARED